jgi:peptidoglycan glycosyltransferase
MNRQIGHLYALVVLLFAVLVAFTSRWTVWEADELEANAANRRGLLEEQRVPRGLILARDGTVLARSRGRGRRETRRYERVYPEAGLFAHAIGYSYISLGRAGLEKSLNPQLTGESDELQSIVRELSGTAREGDDVRTTLDADAQRTALDALGGRAGSIVALEPATGRVRVMASTPGYDPNEVPERFSQINRTQGSPILNRATQGRYPPGSTFKVVTAAAALDSGRYEPSTIADGSSPKQISGAPLANFGGQSYGPITLTDALTNSVNTVWAEVGVNLGGRTMAEYMERFGFGDLPPMDYPPEQMTPSGIFSGQRLISASRRSVDLGRLSIGQERLQVTPLQMAMVAAAVGNGGTLMAPRLVERVTDAEGRVVDRGGTEELSEVMSREAAGQLTQMMAQVVEEGSGTAAALEGARVAGKTGTAEVDGGAANQAWFIGFAPVERPKMAVAVTIERTQGQGGTVAAPLAKRVLGDLIG